MTCTTDFIASPSYNNSRCVYVYIFPVPRIVATALTLYDLGERINSVWSNKIRRDLEKNFLWAPRLWVGIR